ncbi:unnamed protein product, partial [Medioppia subpectinata]
CGDKARGNNYNVLSCDPCKCVFKRNAHKYESLNCIYDNNCTIDVLSRKHCRKCRLRKCFTIGMRKEMILSEDEKTLRLDLIQENRRNRQSTADTQLLTSQSTTPETNDNNTILVNNKQTHGENDYSIVSLSIERPIAKYLYIYFNDMETKRLSEWFDAINRYSLPTITSDYQLDVINKFNKNTVSQTVGRQLLAIYLELIALKMVKVLSSIDAFVSLTQHDQITIIKYGAIELCMVLSALHFENKIKYYRTSSMYNSAIVGLLFQALRNCNTVDCKHGIFNNVLDNVWEYDWSVISLLIIIIMFNPNRPHLIHRDVIEFQQHVYKHLLKKYLHFKYRSEYESSHNCVIICGGKARGKNYGAISCESCKTTFRRNVHKYESLNCIYDNNCTIDVIAANVVSGSVLRSE